MSNAQTIINKVNDVLKSTGFSVCEYGKETKKEFVELGSFKTKIKTERITLMLNKCTNIE